MFTTIESSNFNDCSKKVDGYLLFETDNEKYIAIGYKIGKNHYIKLMNNYEYINADNVDVSEKNYILDID